MEIDSPTNYLCIDEGSNTSSKSVLSGLIKRLKNIFQNNHVLSLSLKSDHENSLLTICICWHYQHFHPSRSAFALIDVTCILSMKVCLFEQVTATPSISLRNLSIDGWDVGGWPASIDYDRVKSKDMTIWQCDNNNMHGRGLRVKVGGSRPVKVLIRLNLQHQRSRPWQMALGGLMKPNLGSTRSVDPKCETLDACGWHCEV